MRRMPFSKKRVAGAHRPPDMLFRDSIERALGWISENELRDLVNCHTGVQMSLGDANRFSQEVADLVVRALQGKLEAAETDESRKGANE